MHESIFEKNIAALCKKRPKLTEELRNCKASDDNGVRYEMINVGTKEVLCGLKGNEGYQLESVYSNDEIIDKVCKKYESSFKEQTFIMFGLGNGMFVKKMLDNVSKDIKRRILVVETSVRELRKLCELIDYSDIFINASVDIYVCGYENITLEAAIYNVVDYANLKGVQVFEYPNYANLFPSFVKEFYYKIRTALLRINADREAIEYFGSKYYSNVMRNYKSFIDSYSFDSLKDNLPANLTAIIVSSGPSLSKNIQELHKAKGHSLIVAVDSSLRVLLNEGIIPDVYISIDATKAEANYDDERIKDIAVIGELTLPPYAFKDGQVKFITFENTDYIIRYFYKKSPDMNLYDMREGASVANAAFVVLRSLGIKKYIFCGQDLAYTDNKAHADNVAFDDDAEMKAEALYVKDVYGNTVRSSRLFVLYKSGFENEIRKASDITVIDSTEGGAYIEGTVVMPLKESIKKECNIDFNIKDCTDKCSKIFNEEDKKDFIKYICDIPGEIKNILKLAEESAQNYERMLTLAKRENRDNKELLDLYKRNEKISQDIDDNPAMTYINYLIQGSVHNVMVGAFDTKDNAQDELMEACVIGVSHAKSIREAAQFILKDIEEKKYFDEIKGIV